MHLYSFHMTGDNKTLLIECLNFLSLRIKSFKLCTVCYDKTPDKLIKYLTFSDLYNAGENNYLGYAFPPTNQVIAEQIYYYLDSADYNSLLTGYEEDYSTGWEIFCPDWYSDAYGITEYDGQCLAVKPAIIEWGK